MIKIRDLTFEYFDRDEEGYLTDMINAIRGINFDAEKGNFIAVAGKNGSGKSTFAKILNRLLVPIEGTVLIGGMDAMDEKNTIDIRKIVGMVFQNPDDQIIGSVVAEDVAFGAENLGVRQEELWERVLQVTEQVGLNAYKRVNELSGGEKQKVAIAGILAMKPQCIVLDESTSMLDPKSRMEILQLMKELNQKHKITIIMITHMMDELLFADTIYIMNQGRLVMKGRKESIIEQADKLVSYGLECPKIVEIKNELHKVGMLRDKHIYSVDALVKRLQFEHPKAFFKNVVMPLPEEVYDKVDPVNAILINDLSCAYGKNEVLKNVSFSVSKGDYVAIIGATGSGKSTLLQHIPGLIKSKPGTVFVDGLDVMDKSTDLCKLRCKIGYVFQYPEQQLFARNVYEDVVFGPRNVGISEIEAEKRAYEAIKLVGLSEDIYDVPINNLSGGQKRRVALAGVLAMKPEYLILDEPVAGLDPEGRRGMLEIINALNKEAEITIIMVSHDIESVAEYANKVIVLDDGEVTYSGNSDMVFYNLAMKNEDKDTPIKNVPVIMELLVKLRNAGLLVDCMTSDYRQGIGNIINALNI